MADNLTIEQYLSGKVRNITVPDDAIASILLDAGCGSVKVSEVVVDEETGEETIQEVDKPIDKDTDITLLSIRERELSLAWLYVWIGIIAFIKAVNIVSGFAVQKTFMAVHSDMNKVPTRFSRSTGLILSALALGNSSATASVIRENAHETEQSTIPSYLRNLAAESGEPT